MRDRKHDKHRVFASCILVNTLLIAGPSQTQNLSPLSASRTSLQHNVSVALKLIQVYVTDGKGNPVPGLVKSDFELFDDGENVEITDFEDHVSVSAAPGDSAGGVDAISERPNPAAKSSAPLLGRKFIILFDFAYNNARGIVQAKTVARRFLEEDLRPEDNAAVMSISISRGLAVHETLTTRHDLVAKAVAAVNGKEAAGRADEIEEEYWRRQSEGNANSGGRSLGGKSLFQLNAERQDSKAQASLFLDMMIELARALRQVTGPKHILLFSTGMPESLVYGNRMNQYMVLESGGRVRTVYDAGDSILIRKNETMLKEFAGANCSLFSFDTRDAAMVQSLFTYDSQTLEEGHRNIFSSGGVSQNANQAFKDDKMTGLYALRKAAGGTGGEYFSNIKEYEKSLARVRVLTDNFYVLGYRLNERQDGKFHKIHVQVKAKGCTARTQAGYYNPKPFRDFSDLEKRLHLADLALSPSPDVRIPIEPRISGLVYDDRGESVVTLFTGISPDVMRSLRGRRVEFVTLVFDSQDKVAWTDRLETVVAEARDRQALHVAETTLGPGRYRCRLVLRDMDSGEAGVSSSDLVIKDRPALGMNVDTPLLIAEKEPPVYLSATARDRPPKWRTHYGIDSDIVSPIVGPSPPGQSAIGVTFACSYWGLDEPNVVLSYQLIDSNTGKETPFPLLDDKAAVEPGRIKKFLQFAAKDLRPGRYYFYARARDMTTNAVAFAQTALIVPPE